MDGEVEGFGGLSMPTPFTSLAATWTERGKSGENVGGEYFSGAPLSHYFDRYVGAKEKEKGGADPRGRSQTRR